MRTRRRASFLVVLASVLIGALALLSPGARASNNQLATDLNGSEETPVLGDPDGSGFAQLIFVPEQGKVCYVLQVRDILPATLAHIHVGDAGVAGPVVVNFSPPTRGASGGCVLGVSQTLIQNILANPSHYYVNVHNSEFMGGAVRGQLGD
jgi:hypothetical protein